MNMSSENLAKILAYFLPLKWFFVNKNEMAVYDEPANTFLGNKPLSRLRT